VKIVMQADAQSSNLGFRRVMACITAALIGADLVLAHAVRLGGLTQSESSLPPLVFWVALAVYCRWRKLWRVRDLAEMAAWSVLLAACITVLIQVAGRSNAPLVDCALSRSDSILGVRTASVVQWIAALPKLRRILDFCYATILPSIWVAIIVPTLCGRCDRTRRYVLAGVIAAIATAALFMVLPAIGPWAVQGYAPTAGQAAVERELLNLKSNHSVLLNPDSGGVVSFPSFHVVLALLCAAALWPIWKLRWIVAPLSALVCLSTITTGWHYGIDVLGGAAVAAMAQSLAVRILAKTDKNGVVPPPLQPVKIAISSPNG
jgi:membrane-associated phospholipid phosphatase